MRPSINVHSIFHGVAANSPEADITGDGIAVTLLHGVGGDLSMWDGVLATLPRTHPVLRYDLRGHGESDKPAGPYTLDDFVDDHIQVLDEHHIERSHLVGFSLGGLIAQAIALRHPDRVAKLVLISTIAERTPQEQTKVRARCETLRQEGAAAHLSTAVDRWFTDEFARAHPEVVEYRRARSLRNDPVSYAAAYRVLAENDLAARLNQIPHNTLVMTGECDSGSTARMAQLMADRIPRARAVLLPRLKHSVLLEAPQRIGQEIHAFLDSDQPSHRKRQ